MDTKLIVLVFLGIFLVDSTGGISGGKKQTRTWESIAAILNSRNDYICTGAILTKYHILTSASCLGYYADFGPKDNITANHSKALFIRIKNPDRRKRDNIHLISTLIKHDNWTYEKPEYDCAILKVEKDLGANVLNCPFNNETETEADMIFPGQDVKLFGWGATRENFPNDYFLHVGESFIITNQDCQDLYPDENINADRFFCTHKHGTGACSGDDGGPVAHKIRDKHRVIGIIGFRKGCGYPEYPDVHVNIFSVLKFINKNIE